MSRYLRDEALKNLSLSQEALEKIDEDFKKIVKKINDEANENSRVIQIYTIRFGNKGFTLFSFDELMKHFSDARYVVRIVFNIMTEKRIKAGSLTGKHIELWLDATNENNCKLLVEDDYNDWVNSTFLQLMERINSYKNMRWIVRNRWVPFLVQIMGVFIGIILSLLLAIRISTHLTIQNSFAFSFIASLLLFSNIWNFLYERMIRVANYFWPNVSFKKLDMLHSFIVVFISTAFVSAFLFILEKVFSYILESVKSILQ